MRRALVITAGILAGLALLAGVAGVVLTGTDVGRERVRRLALGLLADRVDGTARVERIEGNLLGRFSLVNVRIADRRGDVFLEAPRITARLAKRSLLSQELLLTELTLDNPVITLSRRPGEEWNASRLFITADDSIPPDTTVGWGSWIELRNVTVTNGTIHVLQPWEPDEDLSGAASDSAVAAALAGETRARVDRVEWGYRQTMDFRAITARFPTIIVAHPDSTVIALPQARASMVAAPFHPPEVRIVELAADVRYGNDSLTLRPLTLRLPGSRLTGAMRYGMADGELHLALAGEEVAFADLRALYPPLPERGGGMLDLEATIPDTLPSEYVVTNARLRVGDARIEGSLGLRIGRESTAFHETDIRLARFPLALLEQLVPGTELPTRGEVTGRAELQGPLEAMRVSITGSFDPARHAPFTFTARGGLGFDEALTTDRLAVSVNGLRLAFAREFAPQLPLDGVVSATGLVSGSPATALRGRIAVTHVDGGTRSHLTGSGTVTLAGTTRLDVDLRLDPVALELAQRFAGETEVGGDVTGEVRLRGPLDRLSVLADLTLPRGRAELSGEFDFIAADPTYDATLQLEDIDVQAIAPSLPSTSITGQATVVGAGTDPATMETRASVRFLGVIVDSAVVDTVLADLVVRDGMLTVDSLQLRTTFATADAGGTLGLVEGRDGRLTYRLEVGSLAALERWIGTRDTSVVEPRPAVRERAERLAARADSIREAQQRQSDDLFVALAAEEARARRGGREMVQVVPTEPPIPVDSISGSFEVTGAVTGHLAHVNTTGAFVSGPLVYRGNFVGAGAGDFALASVQGDSAGRETSGEVTLAVDSIRAAGFALDSTRVRATYERGEGEVAMTIFPGDTAAYRIEVEYALRVGEREVRLRDLELRFDTETWQSTRASSLNWRGRGITIDSLELRTVEGGGRIFVHGDMPDVDAGNLVLTIDSLRVAPWIALMQSDLPADGLLSFSGRVEGTQRAPRMSGALQLVQATYDGTAFPELHTTFSYDDRMLRLEGDLRRAGGEGRLAEISGALPIDLSLGDSVESRLIEAPLVLDIRGDSIPLSPLAEASDALTALEGRGFGDIGIRGTYSKPRFEGELGFDLERLALAATGVTYRDGHAYLRSVGDTVRIDSLVLRNGGQMRGEGVIVLADLLRPIFDVRVAARDARVLDNEMGDLNADAQLRITGPLDSLVIGGSARITRGVIRIPDPERAQLISTNDPSILAMVDTNTARSLDLDVAGDVTSNLRVNVDLEVARGVWARSLDANVEVYGNLGIVLDPASGNPTLTGALFTEQGDYEFLGRRFVVSRGSVRFTGGPALNPTLQVLANYQVRQAGRAPLDIRIIIGGTLESPQLSLESDAQPPLSQSDLISFLAFGRSSSSLLTFQGSGLEGGGAGGGGMVGQMRALVTRQLAGIALGALVDEVEQDLVGALRADILNITPANLPADLSLGTVGTLVRGTEIEIGKYVDRRTFVVAQVRPTLVFPGAFVERRFGERSAFRTRLSFETRFQPQRPTLSSGLTPETIRVLGGILTWTIGW